MARPLPRLLGISRCRVVLARQRIPVVHHHRVVLVALVSVRLLGPIPLHRDAVPHAEAERVLVLGPERLAVPQVRLALDGRIEALGVLEDAVGAVEPLLFVGSLDIATLEALLEELVQQYML